MPAVLGIRKEIQTAATTGNGLAADCGDASLGVTVYIEGTGTISGGTIVVEEALTSGYTGTWSTRQSITASSLTGGAVVAVAIVGVVQSIRSRISSNITGGGTVTITVVGA